MKNLKRYKGATAFLLGLSMVVPVGSAFAAAPDLGPEWELTNQREHRSWVPDPAGDKTGEWKAIGHRRRSYFVPNGAISRQSSVVGSSERLVNTQSETKNGPLLKEGTERIGRPSIKEVDDPASDKVQTLPSSAEVVGNEWVEYQILRREKAFKRYYSQQERQFEIYGEQSRNVYTYQVVDQVRTVESWTDPVTKQVHRNVVDSSQKRMDTRYSAWTENGKQNRVDAGTITRNWGPDLLFTRMPDVEQVAKRVALTPPGGSNEQWNLVNSEVIRYFQAGNEPPLGARPATDARAREIKEGVDANWELAGQETVRYFLAGTVPPAGGVAATPEQRRAMLDPASTGEWLLSNSETFRYFVPGATPPKDANQATPEQAKQILAEVATAEWQLVDTKTYRDFVAGNVPPKDAGRSEHPDGWNPMEDGAWTVADLKNVKFFVPVPNFENPIPTKPANPAPEVVLGDVKRYPEKSWREFGDIRMERTGLLIKRFQPVTQVIPQTQTETTIHRAYNLEPYTTFEYRDIPIHVGGNTEYVPFQVPVKNHKWVLQEVNRTSRQVPYQDYRIALGDRELASERSAEVGALALANGDRPSSFQGDAASSAKAGLEASKLRDKLGANRVKASQVVLTPAQAEQAKKKAEEEARKQFEEEQKRQAEEEAKRKAEREDEAKKALLDALNQIVASLKQEADAATTQVQQLVEATKAALDAAQVSDKTRKELNEKYEGLIKDLKDLYKDVKKTYDDKYAEALKDPSKAQAFDKEVSAKIADFQKKAGDKAKDLSAKIANEAQKYAEDLAKQPKFTRDSVIGTWKDKDDSKRKVTISAHNSTDKVKVYFDGRIYEESFDAVDFGKKMTMSKSRNSVTITANDDGTLTIKLDHWFLGEHTYKMKK